MIRTWNARFTSILFIALITTVAISLVAPGAIAWYFNPPVDVGVNCTQAVVWGMRRLQNAQLAGLVLGFVLGAAITFMLSRGGSRKNDDDV